MVVGFRSTRRIGGESVAEPAQRKASGLGDAHDVPPSGNGMAKSVYTAARIECRAIGSREDDAGRADGGADGSGRDDAHAYGASGLIAGTRDHGSAGGEPTLCSALCRDFRANVGGFVERG